MDWLIKIWMALGPAVTFLLGYWIGDAQCDCEDSKTLTGALD